MTTTKPPEPQADPAEEPHEDSEWHLLPSPERLREMTPEQRAEIRAQVADWEGDLVERWQERVGEEFD
jgi:hypothetical protein